MIDIICESLVLHKRRLKEADRLYTLLTPERGRVLARLKSAARSRSKLAGSLEVLTHAQVHLISGREFYIIAGTESLELLQPTDLFHQRLTEIVREFLLKATGLEQVEAPLFNLTKQLLVYLKNCQERRSAQLATHRYLWRSLNLLGFAGVSAENLAGYDFLNPGAQELLKQYLRPSLPNGQLNISLEILQQVEQYTRQVLQTFFDQDFYCFNNSYAE